MSERESVGCECDCGCDRRDFLSAMSAALGGLSFAALTADAAERQAETAPAAKAPAVVRAAFLYPPSQSMRDDPNGWWSWPGNDFDAEGRQRQYTEALRQIEKRLGIQLTIDRRPIAATDDAKQFAADLQRHAPDGLLLVMFYNRSLADADLILKAAEAKGVPAVFFIGLGVKHGPVTPYRRPGLYFIQSLDNLEAVEYGLRMIHAKKRMSQSRLLSVTEARAPSEATEPCLGVKIRVLPFATYAEEFAKTPIDAPARKLIGQFTDKAREVRQVSPEALENAARAHFTLLRLLQREQADGVTMTCLKRGMLKPCMSFATLNSQLVPAACENDVPAALTQLLGQLLVGRPGFQHNPCYDTERNHYYASHCTCPTKIYGPAGSELPYLLRRFAHTNEGSCAIQVFWKVGDPVTMIRYYPGPTPALDVYAGRVVMSHPMPPAAGCTTNVEIELTDRADACMVRGHHNLLFAGDFARKFRLFAQFYKIKLAATGYNGPWPGV